MKKTLIPALLIGVVSAVALLGIALAAVSASLVKDIYPGAATSVPDKLTDVNGTLFFRANDGVNGVELWKSEVSVLPIPTPIPGMSWSGLLTLAGALTTLLIWGYLRRKRQASS